MIAFKSVHTAKIEIGQAGEHTLHIISTY